MLFQSFSRISFPYANVLSNSPSIIIHLSYIPIQLEKPSASPPPFSVTAANIQTYEKGAAPKGAAPAELVPMSAQQQPQPPQPLLLPQPQLFPLPLPPQQQHRMMISTMIHRQPLPPNPLLQHPI